MEAVATGLLALVAVLILPIEARVWRAGRLSDRWITLSVLGRMPVLVFVYGLIRGHEPAFIVGTTALMAIPAVLLYRTVFDLVREQRNPSTASDR